MNWRFLRGIEAQFLALQKGFNEVIPQHLLKTFDEKELEVSVPMSRRHLSNRERLGIFCYSVLEESCISGAFRGKLYFWYFVVQYRENSYSQEKSFLLWNFCILLLTEILLWCCHYL